MLTKIIAWSVNNKLLVAVMTIALVIVGVFETKRLPIDAVPDITNNQVQIITVAPSMSATDIERIVTFPVEQINSNIAGIKELRSFSRFGLSVVTIVFQEDVDIYWARQQVAERLSQIQGQIPASIGKPELGPITTGLGEVYQYIVKCKVGYEQKYSLTELRTIQDWIIRRQLLGVEGVADINSFGGKLKQYVVTINSAKLHAFNISTSDVFNALEKNNRNTGGAYIERGPELIYIKSEGLVKNIEDIENIAVKQTAQNIPILIKDIAEVKIDYAIRYGALTYNNVGEVAGAVVMMLKGANSGKVVSNIKKRIEEIKKTLPEGVDIEPYLDRSKMVNNAISTVTGNLMEGALIVVFILVLLLGNIRAGFIVASVIPLSMLFTIIMMNMFGVTGNLMSLGALDFGLIVDGAVIIVEAVLHHLSKLPNYQKGLKIQKAELNNEVNSTASKMVSSAVFGQIIILVVYLPIFTLQGIEGKMFKPMAQTVAFALLGAFILSLTYVPMISALLLNKKPSNFFSFSNKIIARLELIFEKLLLKVLQNSKKVIVLITASFVISVLVFLNLGGEFIPSIEEGDFAVETRILPGSGLNKSIDNSLKAAEILINNFPEIEKIVGKIGTGEIPTDPMPVENTDLIIVLKPKNKWTSADNFSELAEKMKEKVSVLPGVSYSFQFPVQMRFNELMTGSKQDIVCKIFGENLDTLSKYANILGEISTGVKGVEGLYIEPVTGSQQIVINYNRKTIAQYNLNIDTINDIVTSSFAGKTSGQVYEGEKHFDIVVRSETSMRSSIYDIENLLIPVSSNVQIPLNHIAEVKMENSPNQIQREFAKRRIVVGFNARGRDVESMVKELQTKVEKKIKLPPGYYITYGGTFEKLNEAKERLAIAVPIALLLIFILLYIAFKSLKLAALIYSAIPLSTIGGVFFLALRGLPFSISAGVGFIALFGVSVLNGIVLIAEFNTLKQSGKYSILEIITIGSKTRLRPVLLTALVASLGFLPMAISNGAGAEVQRPLATVVIGGLLTSTFLTLFVLPILYRIIFNFKKINFKSLLIVGAILVASNVNAQSISYSMAIDSALKNSLILKGENYKALYQRELIKSGFSIPQAQIGADYGQINSRFNDNRIFINQSINFPTVYNRQKSLLNEEYKLSLLNVTLNKALLKKQVAEAYCELSYLQHKEELLLSTDSVYTSFLNKMKIAFNAGQNNMSDISFAEINSSNIKAQLLTLKQDVISVSALLSLLINSTKTYASEPNFFLIDSPILSDSLSYNNHPILQASKQQFQISKSAYLLERSKVMPDLHFSYASMTMKGTGADGIDYGYSSRFQAITFGIGVPLFFNSQGAKIKSSKRMMDFEKTDVEFKQLKLKTEFNVALKNYLIGKNSLDIYKNKQLVNANTLLSSADMRYKSGEINYFEWSILYSQVISVKSYYLDLIRSQNFTTIQLNYLSNSN
ncbi:MAG: CusA/CzcA family heavy metal efflux RND transporter [Bacteroidetes bacterium]|nr:CusA/CzcA family heavy metal efflux RND transporter [Bacteroidota bacterium]